MKLLCLVLLLLYESAEGAFSADLVRSLDIDDQYDVHQPPVVVKGQPLHVSKN